MAGEDPAYTRWMCLHQRCVLNHLGCRFRMAPHHPTQFRETGHDAKRAHDMYAIPMCGLHHTHLHMLSGPFKGLTGGELRDWEIGHVLATRMRWARHQAVWGGIAVDEGAFEW